MQQCFKLALNLCNKILTYGDMDLKNSLCNSNNSITTIPALSYVSEPLTVFCILNNFVFDSTLILINNGKPSFEWFFHTQLVRGGHNLPLFQVNPPLSKILSFLEIQDVPNFYRPIGKAKVLNESFNRFVPKF